jgi:cell division protein FtsI/penicillin-binding protein 2
LPADQPRFAFAALYEGDVDSKVHGGSAAAPMIAQVFKDVYKQPAMANNRRPAHQEIRRAQAVEEDESD